MILTDDLKALCDLKVIRPFIEQSFMDKIPEDVLNTAYCKGLHELQKLTPEGSYLKLALFYVYATDNKLMCGTPRYSSEGVVEQFRCLGEVRPDLVLSIFMREVLGEKYAIE